MKRNLSILFGGMVLGVFLRIAPACAFGWPTFDLAEVFNTISSTISQVQSQISTTMETYSIANIQQAIGDKLGGLQKIKDAKAKIEKAKEKLEKAKKRAEKVIELKKKYEQAAKDAINEVKDAYSTAKGYVDEAKNQVENVKNQVEGAVDNVKNQVENVKNQVEGAVDNVKNQVEGAKNQVENAINGAKNEVNNIKNQVENTANGFNDQFTDLFSSPEDNFDFETTLGGGTQTGATGGQTSQTSEGGADDFFSQPGESLTGVEDLEWGEGTTQGNEAISANGATENNFQTNTTDGQASESGESESDVFFSQSGENSTGAEDLEWDEGTTQGNDEVLTDDANENKPQNIELKEGLGETQLEGRKQVKAFGKVSFYLDFRQSYASSSNGFKTGTDSDGNFYFPDAFAQWAGINFDDEVDEDKFMEGVDKICADLKSPENHETQEFDNRFDYEVMGQMRAAAEAHSSVIKNEAESGKTLDDLLNMNESVSGTTMMQNSGFGEIGEAKVHYNKQEIIRLSDEIFARVFEEIRKYAYHHTEEEKNHEKKGGFTTGTDNDGNVYFPQRMAEWCNLNFDSDISTETMKQCLGTIANDYYSPVAETAYEARIRFRKMKMESVAHAFITALEAKQKFATDKEEEAVEKINTEDADNVSTMDAGNAVIDNKIRAQEKEIEVLKYCMAMLDGWDIIESNGEVFVTKDGGTL